MPIITELIDLATRDFQLSQEGSDDELLLEHIARLIRGGFTSGYYPHWNLDVTKEVSDDDAAMDYIAKLIEDGCTSGYYPTWSLTLGISE